MNIDKLSKEELELYSHKDITYMLIKENGPMNTADLFKKITDSLELPKSFYENKIGDYYTTLTTDKRFILLDDGNWDLKENHKSENLTVEEDLEDFDEETQEDYDDNMEQDEIEDDYSDNDEENDTADAMEEYKNLVIVDEEDLEQN